VKGAKGAGETPESVSDKPMRPTRETFRQFLELARPEAPAFGAALGAVAVVRG
jgi:hypothetical protein